MIAIQRFANLASGYTRLAVDVLIRLYLTRILINNLGIGQFGIVSFVISLGVITNVLTNALSGAASRYVTQSIARKENAEASSYITNTLAIVTLSGLVITFGITAYALLSPGFNKDVPVGFLFCMLTAGVFVSLGGVLSCGTFAKEKFYIREGIRIFTHSLNIAIIAIFLLWFNSGIWSVGYGTVISGIIEFICFVFVLKLVLPNININANLISSKKMGELFSFVSWMLLAYCGQYIIRSGTMLIIQQNLSKAALGQYALAFMIGGLSLQFLTFISYLTAPSIYKFLAHNKIRPATAYVERFAFLAVLSGLAMTAVLITEGGNLTNFWLGNSAPAHIVPLFVAMVITSTVTSLRIPLSTFLAGSNRLRGYGIITLMEGIIVVCITLLITHDGKPRLLFIIVVPAVVALIKNTIILPFIYRGTFYISPLTVYLKKTAILIICFTAGILLWKTSLLVISKNSLLAVTTRTLILLIPFGCYILTRTASGAIAKKARTDG